MANIDDTKKWARGSMRIQGIPEFLVLKVLLNPQQQ